jgi:hypothetical protein
MPPSTTATVDAAAATKTRTQRPIPDRVAGVLGQWWVDDHRQEQPLGEEGVRFSLEKVAAKVAEGRLHPDVRAWATRKLKEAGNPAGAKARGEVLLNAIRAESGWAPDPTAAEFMPGAHLMLSPDGVQPPKFALGDCFPQGTLLLAEGHRLIPVEEVLPGMKIWGLDRWSSVESRAFKGSLSVDCIRLNNGSDVKLTADHHVYVLDCVEHPMLDDGEDPKALPSDRHWRGTSDTFGCPCRASERVEKRARVAELRRGMVMPTPERIPFGTDAMDPDTAWIEGLYVADGWAETSRFGISGQDGCPKEEQKRAVQAICENRGIATRWHRKYLSVLDAEWAVRMQQMGTHAPQKHLLSVNLDEGAAAATLRGVMADSGKNTRGEQRTFTTTSRELAVQTRLLHKMFGITCGWRFIENHGGLGSNAIYRLGTRGNSRADQRAPWLLRVRDIDRDVAKLPCWDIQTDDHRVYLPEHDVTVSQCDDLTIAYLSGYLAAVESVGARAAVVGHSYSADRMIGHVLGAVFDKGRWWYADPSLPDMPFGECKRPTRERVYAVPSGEMFCDAALCLSGSMPRPPPEDTRGVFLSINGLEEHSVNPKLLGDFCDVDDPSTGANCGPHPNAEVWNARRSCEQRENIASWHRGEEFEAPDGSDWEPRTQAEFSRAYTGPVGDRARSQDAHEIPVDIVIAVPDVSTAETLDLNAISVGPHTAHCEPGEGPDGRVQPTYSEDRPAQGSCQRDNIFSDGMPTLGGIVDEAYDRVMRSRR